MEDKRRPLGSAALAALVLGAAAVMAGHLAQSFAQRRRELAVQRVQAEAQAALSSIAALVADRARDIAEDLLLAGRVAEQTGLRPDARAAVVRSHLVALNRSVEHYLALWHVQDGAMQASVSGLRSKGPTVPLEDVESGDTILDLAGQAAKVPGEVAALGPMQKSPHDALWLFGRCNRRSSDCVVVLVNMKSLFDGLQRRARLPGTEIWVLTADAALLVDPETLGADRRRQIVSLLTGPSLSGSAILGPLPTLLPFGDEEPFAEVLVWRSTRGGALRWITGVTGSLAPVSAELQRLGGRLILAALLAVAVLAGAVVAVAWSARRQRRLRERLEYLSTINALRDQLIRSEKLSNVGQVASGIAHEIGTPLGVIAINLDQLLNRVEDDHQRQKIDVMKDQLDRICRTIRNLLDFSRPTAAKRQPLDVGHVIRQVVSLVEHRMHEESIALHVEAPVGAVVHANRDQFQQVILNLLLNACDACEGGGQIVITVRLSADDPRQVAVEVTDTGWGIRADPPEQVFEPFYTTKARGSGTGLGLAVVREILNAHGGSVEIAATGERTCFVTRWPRHDTAVPGLVLPTAPTAGAGIRAVEEPTT